MISNRKQSQDTLSSVTPSGRLELFRTEVLLTCKLHEDNKPDSSKSDVSNIEAREDSFVERVHHFVVAIKNAA